MVDMGLLARVVWGAAGGEEVGGKVKITGELDGAAMRLEGEIRAHKDPCLIEGFGRNERVTVSMMSLSWMKMR